MGKAVVDGRIQHLSATSIGKGDPRGAKGCLRAWHFRYVAGKKPEQTKSQIGGDALHNELAAYLSTGVKRLSTLALSGLHLLPEPGPDLIVEHSIAGIVRAAGIPFVGKIDLGHTRGTCITDESVILDPIGTAELIDHKSSKSWDWMLAPAEMVRDIQMTSYGEWAFRARPDITQLRLSQVYYLTSRNVPARKVSSPLIQREQIARAWDRTESVARMLIDVAIVPADQSNAVEANTRACSAFGGCLYQKDRSCSAAQTSTQSMFSSIAAKMLAQPHTENTTMSLLNMINPQFQTAPATPAFSFDPAALQSQYAAAQAAPPPQAPPQLPAGFVEAIAYIEQRGLGMPQLVSTAALARASQLGHPINNPPTPYMSTGELFQNGKPIETPEMLIAFAQQLSQWQPQAAPKPAAVLPPDAPASSPAIAAHPVEGFTAGGALPMTPAVTPNTAFDKPKAKRGPKPKAAKVDVDAPTRGQEYEDFLDGAPTSSTADKLFTLYVDAVPRGQEYEDLRPYINDLCNLLLEKHAKNPDGTTAVDIRCAGKDSIFAFGAWKGYLGALVKEAVRYGHIPAGVYFLDTRGSDIAECVAESLGTFPGARGVR